MLRSISIGSALTLCAGICVAASGAAKPKRAATDAAFSKSISQKLKISHALNRLTFGPRPGDEERVRKMGLNKWIDLQLHPSRIPENPVLEAKLKPLDTLTMNADELVRNYPPPQIIRLMTTGQMPYPDDPLRRKIIEIEAERIKNAQARVGQPPEPPIESTLTNEQIRILRTSTPQQRLAAFLELPGDQREAVLTLMPAVRQQLFEVAPPDLRRRIEIAMGPQQIVVRDLLEGKLLRAVYSDRQLEEVLVDFWFNHFNVFLDKGADRFLVTEYEREAIRPHVLGKFRELLEATAKSPAMLFYLDNWQSVAPNIGPAGRGGPRAQRGLNENYGRELMELHTLGVDGGYTQNDVTEVARCFTGWTIQQPDRGGRFMFNPRMHDEGEKVVLGIKIAAGGGIEDGERVLDLLARKPATARHISRELAQRFVADEPPQALVDRMAKRFLDTGGDLHEVMKTMLGSKEFWSRDAYRSKMKSPLEMAASAVRTLDGEVDYAFNLANQVGQLGEPLYRKLEPTGYRNSSRQWANSASLLARMNLALQLAENRLPGVKIDAAVKPGDVKEIELGSPEFQKR